MKVKQVGPWRRDIINEAAAASAGWRSVAVNTNGAASFFFFINWKLRFHSLGQKSFASALQHIWEEQATAKLNNTHCVSAWKVSVLAVYLHIQPL